jgi:RES domain
MTTFKSYRSYLQFADSIATKWRYARDAEQLEFLDAVFATSVSRQQVLSTGTVLFRAQYAHEWRSETIGDSDPEESPCAVGTERMKPLAYRASEGRANPKGIPYLYLATHQETAVAEVRPWIGSYVSLAQFKLNREIRIVDCVSEHKSLFLYSSEPEPEVREQVVWQDIDRAFSQPVTPSDNTADYVPTQALAEFFREKGLDGIAYGSALGPGHNLVLFDIDAAALLNCGLVQIESIKFSFSDADNRYFVTHEKDPNGKTGGLV